MKSRLENGYSDAGGVDEEKKYEFINRFRRKQEPLFLIE